MIGDIETVWQEYSGNGVSVAVFDDGTQRTHRDLNNNYDRSLSYDGPGFDNNGQPGSSAYHGTAVAGIIASENNTIGGIGVAWGASLVGVNFLDELQFNLSLPYLALNEIRDYDVVNASWGRSIDFSFDLFDPGYTRDEYNAVVDAIASGRDGLGSIMVKAAGNGNNNITNELFGIYGNAQGEGTNSIHSIITVAATARDGFATSYSNWGTNLLVTAPAASVTTDIRGASGYSSGDYTTIFGGTSAATPVVSGVVALMLEANPGLGWRDVHNILAMSAAQTGSAYGQGAQEFEEGAWFSNGASNWNGGGLTFNLSYGFGMVDAYAAVRMAEVWTLLYGTPQTSGNDVVIDASLPGGAVPLGDMSVREVSISVAQNISIEQLYVTVDFQHDDTSQLVIDLVAPDGTVFRLANGDGAAGAAFDGDFTFGVRGLVGTSSAGEWKLRLTDTEPGGAGRLDDVDLQFRGSAATANTVHHLTQDYFTSLSMADAARKTISDTDGGTDWLNLAALQGDVGLVLTGNAILTLSGQSTVAQVARADAFENVALGDGNDKVTGNGQANHLIGGRGDDGLGGLYGADVLIGGAGNDLLTGDGAGVSSIESAQAVFRLYQAMLDRTPDANGLLNWTTVLETKDLSDIVGGFTGSPEFRTNFTFETDSQFVTLLYDNVLGRAPDAAGLETWVGLLERNETTRSEVVLGFAESDEFKAATAQSSIDFTVGDARQQWTDEVFRLYQATFDRLPDSGGLANWMHALGHGMSFLDVIEGFISAPEFLSTYGDTSDRDFVTLLYNNVLGRAPDQAGLTDWMDLLETGAEDRAGVMRGFVQSTEFIGRTTPDLVRFMRSQEIDDRLQGGTGDNILFGGAGRDVFDFADANAASTHVIKDFETWDLIDLSGLGFTSKADVAIANSGQDVELSLGRGGTLTIEDWQEAGLVEANFIF